MVRYFILTPLPNGLILWPNPLATTKIVTLNDHVQRTFYLLRAHLEGHTVRHEMHVWLGSSFGWNRVALAIYTDAKTASLFFFVMKLLRKCYPRRAYAFPRA